mmetsp:Transcript_36435/g.91997  ORF Transcript_36435/g.91997 Transcript_36435/m.91997 type:complete len:257 (+) Transcript_36435:253-1023(+)
MREATIRYQKRRHAAHTHVLQGAPQQQCCSPLVLRSASSSDQTTTMQRAYCTACIAATASCPTSQAVPKQPTSHSPTTKQEHALMANQPIKGLCGLTPHPDLWLPILKWVAPIMPASAPASGAPGLAGEDHMRMKNGLLEPPGAAPEVPVLLLQLAAAAAAVTAAGLWLVPGCDRRQGGVALLRLVLGGGALKAGCRVRPVAGPAVAGVAIACVAAPLPPPITNPLGIMPCRPGKADAAGMAAVAGSVRGCGCPRP